MERAKSFAGTITRQGFRLSRVLGMEDTGGQFVRCRLDVDCELPWSLSICLEAFNMRGSWVFEQAGHATVKSLLVQGKMGSEFERSGAAHEIRSSGR